MSIKVDKSEKAEQNYDLLIQEIESSDDYWGPTFRAIYDGDDSKKFMELLDARIKSHDRQIERLCNAHYQGFIDSIRELLQVRNQAQKLKTEVVNLNNGIQASSERLVARMEELVKARKVEKNIASGIKSLSQCLPVLSTYAKLQKQMQEKRFYPALKTLEQLEHLYLPTVSNYKFTQQMKDSIPLLRKNIKEASMTDLKDFLENIRTFSPKIGEVAFKHTEEQLDWYLNGFNNKKSEDSSKEVVRKKRKAPAPPNPFTGEINNAPLTSPEIDSEDDLSAQDLIDFAPIYRSLHIYTVLGQRTDFEIYFRKQRNQQAILVLQPPTNMHESLKSYQTYLHAVAGFFIVEDHILNTGNGLTTKAYLDELWSNSVPKLVNALRTHTAYCTESNLMLSIKKSIILFLNTLRNYGYVVNQIYEVLHEIRDHYNEVLMQRWVTRFRDILDAESYIPIEIENEDDYNSFWKNYPIRFIDFNTKQNSYPKQFPFSNLVLSVYKEAKEFIYACFKFSEDLNLSQGEVDEMMRKSTNLLLTRTFTGCLSSSLRKPSLTLTQITQIIIDIRYLDETTMYIEDYVTEITGSIRENQIGPLTHSHLFIVARDDAEKQLCEKLKNKLDEFIELENYDWLLSEPQGHASSYVTDLIAFLRSTFQSFTNLPEEVAQTACQAACDHLAKSILNLMLNEDVKQLSMGALQQINLDTLQCEVFAASEPVSGLEEGVLLQYFAELRQILDLFMGWDWPTYFHDYGQEDSKYQLVVPNTAIILLEKIREADKKTVFSVLKKSERDKKKLLETVLKQLRQLAMTAQQ